MQEAERILTHYFGWLELLGRPALFVSKWVTVQTGSEPLGSIAGLLALVLYILVPGILIARHYRRNRELYW